MNLSISPSWEACKHVQEKYYSRKPALILSLRVQVHLLIYGQ